MTADKFARLKRPKYAMPADVKRALVRGKLLKAYQNRPAYQQNDYLGWIDRAKREATRQKRLAQMLDELQKGDLYMKMRYHSGK